MPYKLFAFHFIVIAVVLRLFSGPALAQEKSVQLVGLGDSLMAGYQLAPDESYTAQLEKALREKGINVTIANAGVSGDTSSGGLSRADWSVPDGTDGVILELGANDALRGIPPAETERNLDAIIRRLKERGIPVLLMGILAPPNMGDNYATGFNPIYARLAEKYGLTLYPFFLDGVITESSLKLDDGMHPNAAGVRVMAEKSLPFAEKFISAITGAKK